MKVAWLCPFDPSENVRGGAERHTLNMVKMLAQLHDIDMHVIYCTKKANNNLNNIRPEFTLHPIISPELPVTISGIFTDPRKIIKKVRKIDPDFVHAQMIGAPYGLAAAKLSKCYPTVVTVHTMTFQLKNANRSLGGKFHDTIWHMLEKWEAPRIHTFIPVAPNLVKELKRLDAENIEIIPTGIGKKWFDIVPSPEGGRILSVGRFQKIKGQDQLIKAVKILRNQGVNIRLELVGTIFDKKYFQKLQNMVKCYNLQASVKFSVDIDDSELLKSYAKASIFVLPSMEESYPAVILEAMATSTPVIATRVGGVPQMIEDSETGILINYGKPKEMAHKILLLLNDDNLREKIGNAGRAKVENISWENIAERTFAVYRKILDEGAE